MDRGAWQAKSPGFQRVGHDTLFWILFHYRLLQDIECSSSCIQQALAVYFAHNNVYTLVPVYPSLPSLYPLW